LDWRDFVLPKVGRTGGRLPAEGGFRERYGRGGVRRCHDRFRHAEHTADHLRRKLTGRKACHCVREGSRGLQSLRRAWRRQHPQCRRVARRRDYWLQALYGQYFRPDRFAHHRCDARSLRNHSADGYPDTIAAMPMAERAVLLKALLVHSASWRGAADFIRSIIDPAGTLHHEHWRREVCRHLGFGFVDPDDAVACAGDRPPARLDKKVL
jgi:hypothetical protein